MRGDEDFGWRITWSIGTRSGGNGEDVEGKGVGCKWNVDRILGVVGVVSNIYKLDASDVANIHVKSTWSSGVHPQLSL